VIFEPPSDLGTNEAQALPIPLAANTIFFTPPRGSPRPLSFELDLAVFSAACHSVRVLGLLAELDEGQATAKSGRAVTTPESTGKPASSWQYRKEPGEARPQAPRRGDVKVPRRARDGREDEIGFMRMRGSRSVDTPKK
jgi:hypothetical protein